MKYHWSSWSKLCCAKEEGGIGIRKLEEIGDIFAYKRWWNLRTQQSLWSSFIMAIYSKSVKTPQSNTWRKLMQIKEKAENNIVWRINGGDSNVWWDNWTGKVALAKICDNQFIYAKTKVKEFIQNSNWDLVKLSEVLPSHLVQHISKLTIGDQCKEDFAIWEPGTDGLFSANSAWHYIAEHKENDYMASQVWHLNLPFKISFMAWRLIHKKLPLDDVLYKFGNNIVSRYVCCHSPKLETMHHVFVDSAPAKHVWLAFGAPPGITAITHWSVRRTLREWWKTKHKNRIHKMLIHITPIVIYWELWRQMCSLKYETQRTMWYRKMEHQVWWIIRMAFGQAFPNCVLGNTWKELCDTVEKFKPFPR